MRALCKVKCIRERKTNAVPSHLYVELKKQTKKQTRKKPSNLIDTENRLVVVRGRGQKGRHEMDEGDQKVQTFSNKINKFWEYNAQYGDYS